MPRLKSRVRIPFLAQDCSSGGIGRHAGLKILWAFARAGSSPASSTKINPETSGFFFAFKEIPAMAVDFCNFVKRFW